MKVKTLLAIDQGEHLGGAERFFADLLSHLDADYDIHLITDKNKAYHDLYQGSKVTLHQTSLPRLKPIRLRTYKAYKSTQKKLSELIEKLNPDLILSNTVRTHLLVSPLAKKQKLPLIWMAHDLTFPKILLRRFLKYPDALVSCSRYVQRRYRMSSSKPETIFKVLYPFAVDQQKIDQLKAGQKENVVGFVGKFIPWKGQDIFLRMVHELREKYPDYRFKMIASPYEGVKESEQFFGQCMELCKELLLNKAVKIVDHVDDLLDELANWDILVHCSKNPEPLGRVILEGMAAGCAVIASDLGGPQEIIDDGVNGLLSHPQESSLVESVERLIKDDQLRKKVSSKAQKKVEHEFSWQKVKLQFRELISTL